MALAAVDVSWPFAGPAFGGEQVISPRVQLVAAPRIANAGFANFRDYIFPAKYRFDYTPDDCERFHDAVERTVTPAVARLLAWAYALREVRR